MSKPVKLVAILVARPGKAEALQALVLGMVAPSRAEAGNLRWDVWRDQADPDRIVLDELYVDDAALAAHRRTPHFENYVSKINDLAQRTPLVLDPVDIT